mgnify:CR=1 FL=1
MTRNEALDLMRKCGFEAYKSKEHWGIVFAVSLERFAPKDAEFFEQLHLLIESALAKGKQP